MFSLELLVTISIVMLIIGTVIGVVVGRSWVPPEQQKALEGRLHSAKQELDAYQQDVAKHFMETSRHVSELTQSYRELHEHLAKGALSLANTEIGRQILAAGDQGLDLQGLDSTKVEPPKDWAPPRNTLSESFGLSDHEEQNSLVPPTHPGSPSKPSTR